MISIHAAREGGDLIRVPFRDFGDISIHAAREGGDSGAVVEILFEPISIHAAREGGDASLKVLLFNFKLFQSTPPVKAATARFLHGSKPNGYFNPRRP